jgi:hypothetical protein
MPYAANGIISRSPIEGGIEITEDQYQQALEGMLEGKVVSIDGGLRVESPPKPEPEPAPEPEPQPVTVFSARDYLKRFTRDEYAAARTSSNIDVQWMLDNLIAAQYVDINDPEVSAGLDLLVAEGIITKQRKAELLAPGE